MQLGLADRTQNLKIAVEFVIPPIHESLVITETVLEPSIDRRDDVIYKSTLFSRDDQVFQTLDAGISLGQHEGGASLWKCADLASTWIMAESTVG